MVQEIPDLSGEGCSSAPFARSRPLRTRLLLLVVACILPLVAFGFGKAYSDYLIDVDDAGRQALVMTRTLSLLVQRDLEARLATLQVLALSNTLKDGDIAGFRTVAEAMLAQQLPRANILLLREDGRQLMNTALPPDAPLPTRRDTTSLQNLFATAQPSVSDVFVGAAVHRPVIALEVPVRDANGKVIYSLTLNPAVNVFAEIVHRQQLDPDWIVAIIDRQGTIIARTPHDIQFMGKKTGPVMLSHLLTQTEGVVEITSQDDIPIVAAFSHVPAFGWSVTIGLPRAELVANAQHAALLTFSVGAACLALGLGLAQVMAWRIARPIASLCDLSITLERNNPGATVATGLAETDEVAHALVAAAYQRQAAEAASRQAEQEREQAAALLRTVIETAPSLIYAKDLDGRMVLANNALLDVLGKTWGEVVGRTDREFLTNQTQAETVMATDRRIMEAGQTEVCEDLLGTEGNQPRVWLSTKTPLCNADQQVIGLVGVSVEITERKQVEDRLRLMVDELNHRVKNTLATVQSIAMHTLRGTDRAIRRTLEARFMALASAHDVLTRERWEGAGLIDVIAGALTPYGGMEGGQFQVTGPPLRLQPRAAVALAMGLHELATNALKYGALSVGGQVHIQWSIGNGVSPRLHMIWSERDGPPVTPPVQRGFGINLIERSLAQDLGGTAVMTFAPKGISCAIDAPLAELVASAQVTVFPRVGQRPQGWH